MQEDIHLLNLIQPEIEYLSTKSELSLDDLPNDVASRYNLIRAAIGMSYDSPSYKKILDTLNRLKPKSIKEGTIGSYLFGCLYSSVIEGVPITCTPQCSTSIPGPEGSCCPHAVWSLLGEGGLHKNNNVESDIAYIYIEGKNELSPSHLKTLEESGVSKIISIHSDRKVQDLKPIDIRKRKVKFVDNSHSNNIKMNTYADKYGTAEIRAVDTKDNKVFVIDERPVVKSQSSWLWIILAIIIIGILIWWFFFKNKSTTVTVDQKKLY